MFRLARPSRWFSCSLVWSLLAVAASGCGPDAQRTESPTSPDSWGSDSWGSAYFPFEDGEWGPDGFVGDHEPYAGQGCLELPSNRWGMRALGRLVPTSGTTQLSVNGWWRLVTGGQSRARALLRIYDEPEDTHAAVPSVPAFHATVELGRVDESADSWTELQESVNLRAFGDPAFVRLEWVLDASDAPHGSTVLYADEFLISPAGQP